MLAENKLNIVQEGGLAPLVGLLHSPNPEVAKQSCGCLRNLAVSPLNKEKILQENALPPLINLLESDDPKTQELAASALRNLAYNEAIGLKMVDAGALIPLIDLLTSQVCHPCAKPHSPRHFSSRKTPREHGSPHDCLF